MKLHGSPWLQRLGWRGWLGAVLTACAAFAYATLIVPGASHRDALAESTRLADPPGAKRTRVVQGDAEAELQQFWRTLPSTASVPQWLGRIRSAAVLSGLALHSVDYKLERTPDSPLMQYRITLPARGSYGQVRTFIGMVLSEVPAASVDDIQFKREEGNSRQLDARIRLTLFIAAGDAR